MRKNFIKTILILAVVGTMFASTGITTFAAETTTDTQDTKITLTEASKAALKTVFDANATGNPLVLILLVLLNLAIFRRRD